MISFSFSQFSIRCLTTLTLALTVTFGQAQTRKEYVEGDVIVTFKSSVSESTAKSTLKKKSLHFEKQYDKISTARRKRIGLVRNQGKTTQAIIQELQSDPTVESAEPNYLRWVNAAPNDTRFTEMWALHNTGQQVSGITGTSGADIEFIQAWEKARPQTGEIVVGVIDTGVDFIHPELAPRMWTNTLEIPNNNVDDDSNGYKDDYYGYDFVDDLPDPSDSGYHGTHVAGTIGAQGNNNLGVIGVNDLVKIMALKVSADGDAISTSAIIDALDYAVAMKKRGVPLVALNASYGGGGFSNAERTAILAAGDEDILLCVAAGNETANNNNTSSYPASYRLANMIVVASTDSKDALSSFSNFGSTTVDLAAPGSDILSTEPSEITVKVSSQTYATLPITFAGVTTGVSGKIYDCGIGNVGEFPAGVSGNIALIARGTLTFAEKVANAQAAGATAAIIYNNVSGLFLGTLGVADDWIPSLAISQASGLAIKALALPTSGSISVIAGYQYLDGTSMATPHVTGAVAFAALNFPNETMAARKARILNTADIIPSLQGKVVTGGRLNLNRIVDADADGIADWEASLLKIANDSPLKGGVVDLAYAETFLTTSGTAPFTFTLESGTLPPGLNLETSGTLTGLPTTPGSYNFTINAADDEDRSGSKNFTLVVAAENIQITSSAPLPNATTGAPYTETLTGSGGTQPYTWTVSAGELPEGLTLSASGILSGIPSEAITSIFTVHMTDANQLVADKEFNLSVILSPITIATNPSLPYGVRSENYAETLEAQGGTPPYTWSVTSGSLPTGLELTASGLLQGTPTGIGSYTFRLQVSDAENVVTTELFSLSISRSYSIPIMNDLSLGSTTIGSEYSQTVTAKNYPKSYSIKGLPKGLTYSSKTGIISGRPKVSGEFTVTATASNSAGRSAEVSDTLTVQALDENWIGSFTGVIARDTEANQDLGSRWVCTTTSLGSYTLKVTTGKKTKSAKGYLSDSAPQISASVNGQDLQLILDSETQLVTGTHGTASVTGWRIPWDLKNNPSNNLVGYYSAAMNLMDEEDSGQLTIPQGTGYTTLRVNTKGSASLAGRTSMGDTITSSSGIGPGGETALYQSLYKNLGSIYGTFRVDRNEIPVTSGEVITGSLTWLKPADTSRTYASGFGPIQISILGGYLAPKSSGNIVLGLPQTGTASLLFTDGGLALSATEPDTPNFEFSSTYKITIPAAGSLANPARTTLTINKATGAISGTFTLEEQEPTLKRKVSYRGMIVPISSSSNKAQGYFLLPQIPEEGEKSSKTPILSGGVTIFQSSSPD